MRTTDQGAGNNGSNAGPVSEEQARRDDRDNEARCLRCWAVEAGGGWQDDAGSWVAVGPAVPLACSGCCWRVCWLCGR